MMKKKLQSFWAIPIGILSVHLFSYAPNAFAQEAINYQKPPAEILNLVEYERAPSVSITDDQSFYLFSYRNTYKTLDDLNQQELRLGGLRINPAHQISSTVTYVNNLKIKKGSKGALVQVTGLPAQAKIANMTYSPNQKKLAFTHTGQKGLELWVVDMESASAQFIPTLPLNANLGNPISWMKDNETMVVKCIPNGEVKLLDYSTHLPTGPIVTQADGSISQNRTYQDLLKNKSDEYNFKQIATTELYKVKANEQASLFQPANMYSSIDLSPDGNYFLITTIDTPFSYLVPYSRFPMKELVVDANGRQIKLVNELSLAEIMPKGFMAVRKGKRYMSWRADKPSTLIYVEALDEGDPSKNVEYRDAIYSWELPFSEAPQLMAHTQLRFSGIQWVNDTLAVLSEYWYDTRNVKTYFFNPAESNGNKRLLWDRNYQDIYSDPGSFETKKNHFGEYVIMLEKGKMYLNGDGYTPKGQFPFIDELDVKSLKTKRWYTSDLKNQKEDIVEIIDVQKGLLLVRIESATQYPNYYFRKVGKKSNIEPITNFENPFASIKDVKKEVIKYTRKDGVELSGTLYLPAGYDGKQKLPLLIWAYPAEYKDKNSAGQSSHNPNEFTFPYYGSFVYWVTRGYAVLDDAAFPIIGEGTTEPNDNFIEQLVWNAEAAIDAVDRLGYIDRKRVGVGGHSYGAFMTANLLTHSDLFACGIARSGAYNRTLTPFGFQSEQRNYWEAKEVYDAMSPFMTAHKMKTPMLLVHGEADNNSGTFTLQTERYFQALKGLGAPVRMVILPKESHSYVAKENILHLLWEQDQFLEKHLKAKSDN